MQNSFTLKHPKITLGKPSKKNLNVNFFQIGPEPPSKYEPEFLKKNVKLISTFLSTLHTNFRNYAIMSIYLEACDFVKTESIYEL